MRIARRAASAASVAAIGIVVGVAVSLVAAGPAGADNGAYLKVGDVACTDQVQHDSAVRVTGTITNGTGAVRVRMASRQGGPETEIWRAEGPNLDAGQTIAAGPGRFYRACVTVTRATSNTWYRLALRGYGAGGLADLGPHTATLSPGARACGDHGTGPVRLSGTANVPVRWSVFGMNSDYGFVGEIFARTGSSVNEVFTPGPDIALEEMCVTNISATRATVSFELTPV